MKKIIRYLFIGIVAAIAFLIAIVAIFVAVFDANAYKDDLSDLVREEIGRDLQFHGDVELTIYPALGMKLGAMSFSNAEGFGAQPMIKVKQASISVDLASLIAFSPEIDKLVLRDLEVNLIKNKAGVTNWDDLLEKTVTSGGGDASEPTAAPSDSGFDIKGAFGGLDLQNIRLSWLDQQAGEAYRIDDLDLSTGRIVPNEVFPMTLHLVTSGEVEVVIDLQANIEFLIEKQLLTLSEIALKLNEFEIGGRLQLSDFAKPTPTLRFDLVSQKLDVDALLGTPPATAPGPAPAGETGAAAEDLQISLPMQTLRDLDIDGKLGIAQMKVQNLLFTDFELMLKAENGLLALKPVKLNAYGGKVEASVFVDVKGEGPRYGIDKSIQGIQAGPMLKDFSGQETISGSLNAEANLSTSGEWLSELKRNSNGKLKLAFVDGALNGFNIRHSIDTARAKFRGKEPPSATTLKTDFSSLTISGLINNGVFSSDDLDLQAPLLRVGGKGSADLNNETVNYLVNAKLVGTVEGQQGGTADELKGLVIPVKISGPFHSAKIDVQLDEMLKARADAEKEKLKGELDKQKEELKSEIEKQKEELKQQIEVEKKALADSRKRELEKKKKELEQKLLEKLTN